MLPVITPLSVRVGMLAAVCQDRERVRAIALFDNSTTRRNHLVSLDSLGAERVADDTLTWEHNIPVIQPDDVTGSDPTCSACGMVVESEKRLEAYGGQIGDISIDGHALDDMTWHLDKMAFAIRGIDAHVAHSDTCGAAGPGTSARAHCFVSPEFLT